MPSPIHVPVPRIIPNGGFHPLACCTPAMALVALLTGLWMMAWGATPALAHPGDLDEYGGHFDERTNEYHYHKPRPEMARRKKEYLTWIQPGQSGELRGSVMKIQRPDALWLYIPYRPVYQEFANQLSPASRDDKNQAVLIWFQFVSPESSVSGAKNYREWFHKKVVYELDQKLRDKEVAIQFRLLANAARLQGMVNLDKENINLWLVLNGWSYYVLPRDAKNPAEKEFKKAEAAARKQKLGLWKS